MRKLLAVIVSLVFLMSAFCGCAAPQTNVTEPEVEENVTEENANNEESATKEELFIGISIPVLTNPYWKTWTDFATEACDKLGIKYTVSDANNDDTTQLAQVESLVNSGIDALLQVPSPGAIGDALITLCEDAGVPVLCSGRSPGFTPEERGGDTYFGLISLDHVERGYRIAKGLYEAGARTFVALGGPNGATNAEERQAGLHKFVEEHDDVTLLQELRDCEVREVGATNTENFLSSYPGPGFDGIWCYNDDVAMGAVETLINYELNGKVQVGGVDLNADAVLAIAEGNMCYSNAANAYSIPMLSIVMIYDFMQGIKPEESLVMAEFVEVTNANAQEYYDTNIANVPDVDVAAYSRALNPDATWETTLSLK